MTGIINIDDVIGLYEDNVRIRENNKKSVWKYDSIRKGMYYPDVNRVILYTKNIHSKQDYDNTIMHELYHAHDLRVNEQVTEELALYTNKVYPEVIKFVKELYQLEYLGDKNEKL